MKTNKLYTKTYSYKELTAAVESVLTGPPRVVFSMFADTTNKEYKPSEPDNWIVDAPDFTSTEPVIEGKVQFMIDYWRVADEPVFSEVYLNPTWVDIANVLQHTSFALDHRENTKYMITILIVFVVIYYLDKHR